MNPPSVGLIVLNYNARPFLRDCLGDLLNQTYPNFRVFLIDNCSKDGSIGLVQEEFPSVEIIANPTNYGFGKGFNIGIQRVAKDFTYIGLLNPDIRLDSRWLEESVRTLETHSQVQISTSLVLRWDGSNIDNAGGEITNLLAGIFGGHFSGEPLETALQPRGPGFPVFFSIVNATLIRTRVFSEVGPFDETCFMQFADIDLSWRVLMVGGKIWCNPDAVVRHFGSGAAKSRDVVLTILRQTETGLLGTYFKNLSLANVVLILPPLVAIRASASFLYFTVSPRITMVKLLGIGDFFRMLPLYAEKRRQIQRLRTVGDKQVFSNNPSPLFSLRPLEKLFFLWRNHVAAMYSGSNSP